MYICDMVIQLGNVWRVYGILHARLGIVFEKQRQDDTHTAYQGSHDAFNLHVRSELFQELSFGELSGIQAPDFAETFGPGGACVATYIIFVCLIRSVFKVEGADSCRSLMLFANSAVI